MKISELRKLLGKGELDQKLVMLYGQGNLAGQKKRYDRILKQAASIYGDQDAHLISAPGRTEVGGNHTDHQLGRVLAASIDLDVLAVVIATKEAVVRYAAPGFHVQPVSLKQLKPQAKEKNRTESLIRGVAARFAAKGYQIGGFDAYAESDVLPGSGMSSSAAFEVLLGTIFNVLYNHSAVSPQQIAMIGQYAENVYFGKPSGLLDQMACATGGFVTIDFRHPQTPKVERVPFDFNASGYQLILTDCRQSHADLSDEYGRIPAEMKQVAHVLGKEVLSQCTMKQLLSHAAEIRRCCPDRAFLRAMHFMNETDRVKDQVKALKAGNMPQFLKLIRESGYSSYMYLQNVYPPANAKEQSLAVGLAISQQLLQEDGAYRVHGGGFAGTIQAFVPNDQSARYRRQMEAVFGKGCCYVLSIRSVGGYCIL